MRFALALVLGVLAFALLPGTAGAQGISVFIGSATVPGGFPLDTFNLSIAPSSCDTTPTRESTPVAVDLLPGTAVACSLSQAYEAASAGDRICWEAGTAYAAQSTTANTRSGPAVTVEECNGAVVADDLSLDGDELYLSDIQSEGGADLNDANDPTNITLDGVDLDGQLYLANTTNFRIVNSDICCTNGSTKTIDFAGQLDDGGGPLTPSNSRNANAVIEYNAIHDASRTVDGVDHTECLFLISPDTATIRGNYFYNCDVYNISVARVSGSDMDPEDVLIENNFFEPSDGFGTNGNEDGIYSIVLDHVTTRYVNLIIRNNTFTQPIQFETADVPDSTGYDQTYIYSNIIHQNGHNCTAGSVVQPTWRNNVHDRGSTCHATDTLVADVRTLLADNGTSDGVWDGHLLDGSVAAVGAASTTSGEFSTLDLSATTRDGDPDAGAYEFPAPPPEPFLLIDAEDFDALPTTGAGWDYVNARATDARGSAITLLTDGAGAPTIVATNPSLRSYEYEKFQLLLALAIRYAQTGDGADRTRAVDILRYLIGTEEFPAPDGQSSNDGLLATSRNVPSMLMAADFIGLDGDTTFGSRAGVSNKDEATYTNPIEGESWTSLSFNEWLDSLHNVKIGTQGAFHTIRQNTYRSAHNWASAALDARTYIDLFLDKQGYTHGDTPDLVKSWRRWMGDMNSAYDPPGDVQSHFRATGDSDSSWWCVPGGETWAPGGSGTGEIWRPINPDICAADKSGIIVDDIVRTNTAYPDYGANGSAGTTYSNEAYHFLLTGARAMQVAGYPVETWSDGLSATPTLRRVGDWVEDEGLWPRLGSTGIHDILPWMANWVLGTSYSTQTPVMGRSSSYFDYLSGAR